MGVGGVVAGSEPCGFAFYAVGGVLGPRGALPCLGMLCFGFISPGFTSIAVDAAGRSGFAEMPNPSGSFFIRRARRSRSQGASCSQGAPCFLGRRPCGRLLPTTSRRSAWAALHDVEGKGVLQVSCAAKRSLFARRLSAVALAFYAVGGMGVVPGGRAIGFIRCLCEGSGGEARKLASCRVQLGAPNLLPTATRRSQPPADCKSALHDAEYKSALLGGIVLFGETPMRASPAEYNSALRLGGAPGLVEGDGVGGGGGGAVVVGYG